jgi:hypothetical protein
MESEIERLILLAECGDSSGVVRQLRRLVPTFNPLPESVVSATVSHAAALAAASQS